MPIRRIGADMKTLKTQVSGINGYLDQRFRTKAEKAEGSVKSALQECLNYAKRFNGALDIGTNEEQIKEAIDDLNPNLRDKVKKAISFVKCETERFQKLSEMEGKDFEAMKKSIQSVLTDHGKKVNEHVCREVTALVSKLRVLVRKILDEMKSVEKNLFNYLQNLTTWIRQADTAVNVALDKIEKIINEVSEDSAFSNVKPIKQAAQELHNQVYELFNAGNKANEAADKQVKAALGEVLKLDRAVRMGLYLMKGAIELKISTYVKALKDVLQAGMSKADDMWAEKAGTGVQALNTNVLIKVDELATLGTTLQRVLQKAMNPESDKYKIFGKNVEWLLSDLKKANANWNELIPKPSKDLLESIQTVLEADLKQPLGKELPQAKENGRETDKIDISGSAHFSTYNGLINQTKVPKITGTNTLQGDSSEGTFPPMIKNIETKVNEALSKIGDFNGVAQTQFEKVTSNFQRLCDAIMGAAREGKDSAKSQLEELKTKYFKHYDDKKKDAQESIKKIKHELDALLAGSVKRAVDLGEKFLKPDADRLRDETTEKLKQHVVEEVENAKKQLTHHARKNYISTTKLQLDQFADRVTKELDGLPEAIDDDLITGFKGFMGKLAGENTSKKTSTVNIERLSSLTTTMSTSDFDKKTAFKTLSTKFKEFYNHTNEYILGETKREHTENMQNKNPQVPITPDHKYPHVDDLTNVKSKLDALLTHLNGIDNSTRKYIFDTTFQTNLSALASTLTTIRPASYSTESNPLLDVLKTGLTGMHAELEKAYVSAYDGETITWTDARKNNALTKDAMKCASALLTIISPLYEQLYGIFYYGKTAWTYATIDGTKYENDGLQTHFTKLGYTISNLITKEHSGQHVAEKLRSAFTLYDDFQTNPETDDTGKNTLVQYLYSIRRQWGPLSLLHRYLPDYYKVCHSKHIPKPQYPCSIRDMLSWLSGLTYTSVFTKVPAHCKKLLDEKIPGTDRMPNREDGVINQILSADLLVNLSATSDMSHTLLTTIYGNGHGASSADYPYACHFADNSRNFYYPQDVPALFDVLVDTCRRLLCSLVTAGVPVTMVAKCQVTTGIATMLAPKLTANQTVNQSANEMVNQTLNQVANQNHPCKRT
ncbi:Extracellular matrix-binding ebh, putative [Babesia ovata]|uniref:Extracellular matrix-binding ebh, putative n=1 Tax=Babesia ovata TaxID=189622 RepID=A0A2H6KJZ9_9APIC|nr:Extracellular matrix-binding ebh, putative [Babesia ovata]GBE63312.1 Extracellular matrix-binding ebh, putative [Babesia ovata]